MALTAIAHHANDQNGIAWRTYDALCLATGLSRAKLSNGLDVLENLQVIERMPEGRSTYKLCGFNVSFDDVDRFIFRSVFRICLAS
jgi:hypothetical protein